MLRPSWKPSKVVKFRFIFGFQNSLSSSAIEVEQLQTFLISTDSANSISVDLWLLIIEYLNNRTFGCGFGSILPYRAVNKTFSILILESIKEMRIIDSKLTPEWNYEGDMEHPVVNMLKDLLPYPLSLLTLIIKLEEACTSDGKSVYKLIYDCKNLRSLYLFVNTSLVGCDELQQIGNGCPKLDELVVIIHHYSDREKSCFPTSFFGLSKFSVKRCSVSPPINMVEWTNLRTFRGDILDTKSWAEAISNLPKLIEMKWEFGEMDTIHIYNFCKLCKDKLICKTLEVLESTADQHEMDTYEFRGFHDRITDECFNLVLRTFPNLTDIRFQITNITLTMEGIAKNLANLKSLKSLKFERSHLFFDANVPLINEWLQTTLPYFPKTLEIIQFVDCEVARDVFDDIYGRSESCMIISNFYHALPNLREMKTNFVPIENYGDD